MRSAPSARLTSSSALNGIGPFYAGLIVVRATGFADALLPIPEPKLLGHAAHYYGRSEPPTLEWLAESGRRLAPVPDLGHSADPARRRPRHSRQALTASALGRSRSARSAITRL